MSANKDLFQLIKSLNPSEKRFFRLATSSYKTANSYLKLFDAIDNQEVYDEGLIRKKVGFKSSSQFSMAKSYLMELILENMEKIFSKTSIDIRLSKQISAIGFLKDKGLHQQARKLLKETKQLALENENFPVLLQLYELEIRLLATINYGKDTQDQFLELNKEIKQVMLREENYNEFLHQGLRFYSLTLEKGYNDPDNWNLLDQLSGSPLFSNEKNALSQSALRLFYRMWQDKYMLENNYPKMEFYSKKILSTIRQENRDGKMLYLQIGSINNILIFLYYQKKINEIRLYLKELEEIQSNTPTFADTGTRAILFFSILNTKLMLAVHEGDANTLLKLIPDLNQGLTKYKEEAPFNIVLNNMFNLAIAYFLTDQYQKSKKTLLDFPKIEWKWFALQVQILKCMVFYELENIDLIEREARSGLHILQKEGSTYSFEKLFFSFFRNPPRFFSKKDQQAQFGDLKNKISLLLTGADQYQAKNVFFLEFFLNWINRKTLD